MIWFQAAYDPLDQRRPWVVMRMTANGDCEVFGGLIARYPTRHEAEGHARKNWEKLGL